MCNKKSNLVFFFTFMCSIILILIPTIILYITFIRPGIILLNFNKGECNISIIQYPTYFPLDNNLTNWEYCNCGKRCESITPCIKLYSSYNEEYHIYDSLSGYITDNTCTFHDKKCRDGENPEIILQNLEHSINKAESYLNQTIDCYYDNNYENIFIDNNLDYLRGYFLITLIVVLLLFNFYLLFNYLHNIYLERKKQMNDKNIKLTFPDRFEHLENLEYNV